MSAARCAGSSSSDAPTSILRPCRRTHTSRRSSGRSRPIQSARAGSLTTSWSSWPAGRFALVLTERRAHLDALAALLRDAVPELVTLHGGMGVRARRRAEQLLSGDEPRIVLATGRYIGEGFDDPRLDTLVLAMPIAWSGTMTQYAGRLHRQHAEKREIRILDYVDYEVPVLRVRGRRRDRAPMRRAPRCCAVSGDAGARGRDRPRHRRT